MNVIVSITTKSYDAPEGTVPGNFRYWIIPQGEGVLQSLTSPLESVEFINVQSGSYIAKAMRVDAVTDAQIGDALESAIFSISLPPQTVPTSVPAVITVTLA